ncbi:hypothetical protein C4559_02295 [Candidatus Microgenomates bacterium]|nr:MAG: hypothetical protein C4559_02295 [Candidatus Microgenomates bacterium]
MRMNKEIDYGIKLLKLVPKTIFTSGGTSALLLTVSSDTMTSEQKITAAVGGTAILIFGGILSVASNKG